jgi:folate-binding protein YgfZ
MTGYQSLLERAAWLDISARGRIRVTGEDRVRLLHAIASNDIEELQSGQGTYTFFLDAQGHILTDARVYRAADHVLIDCEPELREKLIAHLDSYIIMDDVALEDQTSTSAALALEGPASGRMAQQLFGADLPSARPHSHRESGGVRVLRGSLSGQPGFCLVCAAEHKQEWIRRLQEAGASAASIADFRVVRVENQIPRCGEDYSDSNLPQETQQLQAVSFSKGCYLGQEIVERVRARGQVNRLLVSLELEADQAPPAGASVTHQGQTVGTLTSPVFSPRLQAAVGFAIVRRTAAAAGTMVSVDGIAARVRDLAAGGAVNP